MKGCLLYNNKSMVIIHYRTPKDVFGGLDFTTCGACIEKDLVLIHNPINNNGVFENPDILFSEFVYDKPLYSPILIIQTNKDGDLIDLNDSFFL